MTNEPRDVYEKSDGTVVGEVGADANDDLVVDGKVVREVQSKADLTDGDPGLFHIQDTDEVVFFDGDTSTN